MAYTAAIIAHGSDAAGVHALREIGEDRVTRRARAPKARVAIEQAGAGDEDHSGACAILRQIGLAVDRRPIR